MNIIIKEENKERIEKIIKEVEGKSKVRKCTYQDLITYTNRIEKNLGISKSALNGTTAWISPHGATFPKAYKYSPQGTAFQVKFTNGTWKVIEICRGNINRDDTYRLILSESAKDAIINRFERW